MLPTLASKLRLLFVLLLSCAVCLTLSQEFSFIPALSAAGNISLTGVTTLTSPINITSRPGPLLVNLTAWNSVEICITPYAAVTSNLTQSCPSQNYHLFEYAYNSTNPLLALFLDDFSMNFRGEYLESASSDGAVPWTPQTYEYNNLLQNINYFVSLSFTPNTPPPNSSYSQYTLVLSYANVTCGPQTVPNNNYLLYSENCIPVNKILQPELQTANLNVSRSNPAIVQFPVPPLTPNLQVILNGLYDDSIEDYNLEIAYNQLPSLANSQYSFNTITTAYDYAALKSKNFTLNNPLPGYYYAKVSTTEDSPRGVSFTYSNATGCQIVETEGTCGNFSYTTLGNDAVSLNFNTDEWFYYAIVNSTSFQFGVQVQGNTNSSISNNTINVLVGDNYFPSPITTNTGIGVEYSQINGTIFLAQNNTIDQSATYIFAVSGSLGGNVIIWQGASCPENCNGNGNCTPNHQCQCNNDYSGDYCQNHSKKLSTLYIILIIIGGAIVLAILIGVPVALYLNNRKRARYERV